MKQQNSLASAGSLSESPASGARLAQLETQLAGPSRVMSRLRERIAAVAPLWTPVLISGEPGCGRDVVARAIHTLGVTGRWEFRALDAANFTPHDRVPTDGLVYLQSVERLSPDAQVFWRKRVGPSTSEPRLRMIGSTADPPEFLSPRVSYDPELAQILLRYRLRLPPLRERRDDIPAIAALLLERIGASVGRRGVKLSAAASRVLKTHRWTENMNQLEEVLGRAVAFTGDQTIRRELLVELIQESEESLADIRARHSASERRKLLDGLHQTGGNVAQTAEKLGRSRAAVYRLIEKHGIALARCR